MALTQFFQIAITHTGSGIDASALETTKPATPTHNSNLTRHQLELLQHHFFSAQQTLRPQLGAPSVAEWLTSDHPLQCQWSDFEVRYQASWTTPVYGALHKLPVILSLHG